MLITRETDYALRALRALFGGEQLTAGEIATSQLIPKQFAYKIIKKLAKAGMVVITRGAGGGCRLTVDLDEITLYDIMQAMDEEGAVTACMVPTYECPWRLAHGGCTIHCELLKVQSALDEELRAHTVHSLICGENK